MGQTLGGIPILDPALVRQARGRFNRPGVPRLECANSIIVSGGRWPTRGWFLVEAAAYASLNKYATDLQLVIGDPKFPQVTLNGLSVVQAQSVTTGLSGDGLALYLVEVTDARGLLYTPWYAAGTTSQYNVTAPAYPGQYYALSLNGGVPWTWTQMIGDLWVQMPVLGAYPGIPIVPSGTPENFIFPGGSAWEALCVVLDLLGLTVAVDLTNSGGPYTIVSQGDDDASFAAKTLLYAGVLEDDAAWIDVGSGRVPGTVTVLFHVSSQFYGTEETVRRDALQWTSSPSYAVVVPSPAPFNQSAGVAQVLDDFIVRLDADGNPLAVDTITADAFAQDRVRELFNKIYSGTQGYLSRCYAGALPFATGSQVDAVRWSQTQQARLGWRTELSRGWVWPEVVFSRDPEDIVGTRDDTE